MILLEFGHFFKWIAYLCCKYIVALLAALLLGVPNALANVGRHDVFMPLKALNIP